MKEVNYCISESCLLPHKTIFAGTVRKTKDNTYLWRTRGDVTSQAIGSVVRHLEARAIKESNKNDKGMSYNFTSEKGNKVSISIHFKKG